MSAPGRDASERRQVWERRWRERRGEDFEWHLDRVPAQLADLVALQPDLSGPALDLGCGEGVTTSFLAGRFAPTVGVDIAFEAVVEARRQCPRAVFVVADAASLPFRDRSAAFLFDRGCLQNLARPAWSGYFVEADRVLTGAGVLQLLCSKAAPGRAPSLLSARGLRHRAKRILGRHRPPRSPQFLSHQLLIDLAPATLVPAQMEDFPFVTAKGHPRTFTHAVFGRPAGAQR